MDQIKEAQLKLGYAKETVRLYYPAPSLMRLLGMEEEMSPDALVEFLQKEPALSSSPLGGLQFSNRGNRIEVQVPPEGAEYVHLEIQKPEFLATLIELFAANPHSTLEEIRSVFASFDVNYICRQMPKGSDFDCVLYFPDGRVDAYYYCVKEEMGHTIYHRFTRDDYEELLR
jgi:hypothetical protein